MNPVSSGYADVDGIKLWHEVYGEGTARADPWRDDDDRRDSGMGAAAGDPGAKPARGKCGISGERGVYDT